MDGTAVMIKWMISICLAILIWPIVFMMVVIAFELMLTIGLIAILAYAIKEGIERWKW
jgi:hypothetical protein|tara:strand:- start:112 stop:285 length:174 start_codon:yes stop_codon:yes gene_type:complete